MSKKNKKCWICFWQMPLKSGILIELSQRDTCWKQKRMISKRPYGCVKSLIISDVFMVYHSLDIFDMPTRLQLANLPGRPVKVIKNLTKNQLKKFLKNFWKSLDNQKSMWYDKRAVWERAKLKQRFWKERIEFHKKLQKILKKLLKNAWQMKSSVIW